MWLCRDTQICKISYGRAPTSPVGRRSACLAQVWIGSPAGRGSQGVCSVAFWFNVHVAAARLDLQVSYCMSPTVANLRQGGDLLSTHYIDSREVTARASFEVQRWRGSDSTRSSRDNENCRSCRSHCSGSHRSSSAQVNPETRSAVSGRSELFPEHGMCPEVDCTARSPKVSNTFLFCPTCPIQHLLQWSSTIRLTPT